METRERGIEPLYAGLEAAVLPLDDSRMIHHDLLFGVSLFQAHTSSSNLY